MDREELAEVVISTRQGNQKALEEIFRQCHDLVYFLALKTVRNHEDALDIVQETYTAIFQSIRKIENPKAFKSWLCQITINKCKRFWERKKEQLFPSGEGQYFEEITDTDEDFIPQSALDKAETRNMIMSLIDILPNEQRMSIMLFYYEGLKVEEIATIMECPVSTVKSRLLYARRQIKEGVEKYEKKGDKLYGIGAVPVLSLLLKEAAKENAIPQEVSTHIFENALKASAMSASATMAKTAGIFNGILNKAAVMPLKTKVIAGMLSGALVITGVAVPIMVADDKTADKSSVPVSGSTAPAIEDNIIEADTPVQQPDMENIYPVSFKDKEIERYVRYVLKKQDEEILSAELDMIEEIFIYGKSYARLKGTTEYASESPVIENDTQYIDENGVEYKGKGAVSMLDDLKHFKNLKKIQICYNEINDITPICGLKKLVNVDLPGNSVNPAADLSALDGLSQLNLADNQITDISKLKLPSGLKSLNLKSNSIIDLSTLQELTRLEVIDLEHNKISDIMPLKEMTGMKAILLQGNSIKDISALVNMQNLESAILFHNEISDITALSGKSKLRELFIFYNKITDISPLKGLTSLEVIWIHNNNIEDLSPLRNIASLKELHMQRNRISDIKPLEGLLNLEVLELSENGRIVDISSLENLTNLKDLKLAYNRIKNINALANLKKLEVLWLNTNMISDIRPLSNLTNLKELYLITNEIEDVSPLRNLTGLRELQIGFNMITDFSPLSGLKDTKIVRDMM